MFLVGEQNPRLPQLIETFRAAAENGVPTHLDVAPREVHGDQVPASAVHAQVEMERFEKWVNGHTFSVTRCRPGRNEASTSSPGNPNH